MKNKVLIVSILITVFIISILIGIFIFNLLTSPNEDIANKNEILNNKIIEENSIQNTDELITANSSEEKINPSTKLVLRKYYEQCGHSINEYVEMPPELINMNKQELQEQYKDWNINVFSEKEVILIKTINDYCNEHYILKELEEEIAIYKIDKNGQEEFQEKTGISTRYLTETDKEHLKNKIKIYGVENLNKCLEDFE